MKQDRFGDDSFDERRFVASSWECTGLIPALGSDDEEADEAALYAIHEQKNRNSEEEETACAKEKEGPR